MWVRTVRFTEVVTIRDSPILPMRKGDLRSPGTDRLTLLGVYRYSGVIVYLGEGSGCRVGGHDGGEGKFLIVRRSRSAGVRSGGAAFYVRCPRSWRIFLKAGKSLLVGWSFNILEKHISNY